MTRPSRHAPDCLRLESGLILLAVNLRPAITGVSPLIISSRSALGNDS